MSSIIDAHVHLWDPARGDYGWLTPALPTLYRRIDPQELHEQLTRAGVHGAVLVQAAPTEAESDYLLSIAERTPWVRGVVGWVDFDAPDIEQRIAARARQAKFVGVRPMLQDIEDVDWILHPSRGRALSALASHGLVFDALIKPVHMARIEQIARRHPDLSIVIDHAAKPTIGNELSPSWRESLRALASHPNVVCKLSGLLTEVAPGVEPSQVLDCAEVVLQLFGPSRVLWGSDWPVLTLASSYDQWHALTQRALSSLSVSDRNAVTGGNAVRIYRMKTPPAAPAILLHPDDNVLVCCRAVRAGERFNISESEVIHVLQDTDLGHKLARRGLSEGDKVIKYGAPIGSMKAAVLAGGWIHLHNMKSDYISAHTRAARVDAI
ncbi:amidohydrolase family protein [Peristeroidobacter agariperforans]|uniref:amidohydrolase family protein n=1 Tax=Peristeroidobacter agariperforans TaxID=268404 RepID=UPI00101DE37D|nr:amidohydrolase family protein [Peristeroidobacter agariperforans]